MALPLKQSYAPMEAKLVAQLPAGDIWEYEPKWDGFRCIAFRDGDEVDLQSKSGQPLGRSFGVKLWPTLVFLKDGREVTRLIRPARPQEVAEAFASLDGRIDHAAHRRP